MDQAKKGLDLRLKNFIYKKLKDKSVEGFKKPTKIDFIMN